MSEILKVIKSQAEALGYSHVSVVDMHVTLRFSGEGKKKIDISSQIAPGDSADKIINSFISELPPVDEGTGDAKQIAGDDEGPSDVVALALGNGWPQEYVYKFYTLSQSGDEHAAKIVDLMSRSHMLSVFPGSSSGSITEDDILSLVED